MTRYYEKKSNQVYVFASAEGQAGCPTGAVFQLFFLPETGKKDRRRDLSSRECSLIACFGWDTVLSYTYASKKGKTVWVEGITYPMTGGGEVSYGFNLEKGKEQVVLVEATISQTDYQVELANRMVSFSTLSGQSDDVYITLKALEE